MLLLQDERGGRHIADTCSLNSERIFRVLHVRTVVSARRPRPAQGSGTSRQVRPMMTQAGPLIMTPRKAAEYKIAPSCVLVAGRLATVCFSAIIMIKRRERRCIERTKELAVLLVVPPGLRTGQLHTLHEHEHGRPILVLVRAEGRHRLYRSSGINRIKRSTGIKSPNIGWYSLESCLAS